MAQHANENGALELTRKPFSAARFEERVRELESQNERLTEHLAHLISVKNLMAAEQDRLCSKLNEYREYEGREQEAIDKLWQHREVRELSARCDEYRRENQALQAKLSELEKEVISTHTYSDEPVPETAMKALLLGDQKWLAQGKALERAEGRLSASESIVRAAREYRNAYAAYADLSLGEGLGERYKRWQNSETALLDTARALPPEEEG